ncbi:MAG: ABC transporter ATP-binding protein, partial [Anaerolineaceae bacterium]|nr:ABC transporter ATP-binding protein [Anaerolineaceae bacterium]
ALAKTSTFLLLRYFIDSYFPVIPGATPLPFIAFGFVLLAVIEGAFTFYSGVLAARTAEGSTRRLRNYLFDNLQYLPFTYHDKTQTGEAIERCTSDVDALRRFFADQAIGVGRIVMLFTINFIALLNLNSKLAWISIIVVPPIVLVSIWFFKRVTKAYELYQEQEAVLSTTLQENLAGVRVVKAFARQQYEMEKFEKDNWEKFIRGRNLLKMHAYFWPITDILCGFQMLAGFLIAGLMTIEGSLSIGSFLAYLGLIVWIIFPMRNLGRLIVQMSTGMVSYGRVMEIIKQEREPLDEGSVESKTIKGEIVFEHVGFTYDAESEPVLEDICFRCKPGEVVALIGSTGSGKTSLVNLLPRFYEYSSGSIRLDGIELNKYSRRFLRSQIGIVEQEPFLFSRSIRENITYGIQDDVPDNEIEGITRAAAIHDVIADFPKAYHTLVGEKGVTLSGGQKQRLAIARTLIKNPRILIMDDSTSSVDTETEAEIREKLVDLMKNRTTFIIAHRIQSIMDADLILVMDHGRVVQRGRHAELIAEDGIYKKIYEIQSQVELDLEKELGNVG